LLNSVVKARIYII